MDFMTVANQMLSLFIIMIIGYVMYRVKIIDDAATVRYTRLVLNISLPHRLLLRSWKTAAWFLTA